MELVYLWVEDYKNIKKQGFNFSPRFRCEYDEKTEELNIIDKDETGEFYPKNFFGDNINVTAIVGGNGSGKSSILQEIEHGRNLIRDNGKYYSNSFKNKKYQFEKFKKDTYKIIYLDYDFIKINSEYAPFIDYLGLPTYTKNLYKKSQPRETFLSSFNIEIFSKDFYKNIIKYSDSVKSEIFFYNPLKIMFSDNFNSRELNNKKLIDEVRTKNFSKEKFLTFLYVKLLDDKKIEKQEFEANISSIETVIIEKFKLENIEKIYTFLEEIREDSILIEEFKNTYKDYEESFLKLINIGYLKIDFTDKEGRKYFDLSQGERKLFTEMLMIFDEIKQSENNNFLLLLDEPDLSLHPDWQKRYISEMIKLLSNFSEKKFHLIVTTHSPFILSDLPKENIIFLEKGKQVYPFDDGKQTFGANIHTLLSHGFFMKDGLMGEFAKDKIQSVINFLNDNETNLDKGKAWAIIQLIGEPFLKFKIEEQFYEKFSTDEEKRQVKIKELEEELQRLKNVKP